METDKLNSIKSFSVGVAGERPQLPKAQQHFKGVWIPMSETPAKTSTYLVSDGVNYAMLKFTSARDFASDDTYGWYPEIDFFPTHWMDIPDCPIIRGAT